MRRTIACIVTGLALILTGAPPAQAQNGAATLIADRVSLRDDNTLVAEGDVEILHGDTRLRATRIIYDRRRDSIALEGPLRLDEGTGFVLLGDSAELDADLRNGILRGARLVLDRRLQIAAEAVTREQGRYTRLEQSVASSCRVCPSSPTPLWEIRAARVIHDRQERMLHFERASFRLLGVPVFYAPRLRLPDPTRARATGFLMPEFRATNRLGVGLRLPYFIDLGPDRDLTLTPYLAEGHTVTLEGRYRQAFAGGQIQIDAGVSRDSIRPGSLRGFVLGGAEFTLAGDTRLILQVETASDRRYLDDYGHDSTTRLTSGAALTQTRRNRHWRVEALSLRSLREGDVSAHLPGQVAALDWQQRFDMPVLGGTGRARVQALALRRSSGVDVVGRDSARARLALDWRRDWILPYGIRAAVASDIALDSFAIRQDSTAPAHATRFSPAGAFELRWPWRRIEASGATQIIEPVAQFVAAPRHGTRLPNDDSRLVSFDEGNLFRLDRAPGIDGREGGRRANLGISWARHAPDGWTARAMLGRVLRAHGDDGDRFSALSGLSGQRSDWLAAMQIATPGGLTLTNRALFDDDLGLTRAEARLDWQRDRVDIATSLVHLRSDPGFPENRPDTTSEWNMDASYRFAGGWIGQADWRYDLSSGRASRLGIGLGYENECARIDVSLSRRFASSTSVGTNTAIGLSVDLIGFGSGVSAGTGSCGT